ncbi:13630_t:CDS:2 [Funneliformis geosporum]|nr:13630_t:CDS:2 [Funneliformis geosporum]
MAIHSRFGKINWRPLSFDKRVPVNKNVKTKIQQKNPQPKNAKQPALPLKKPQNTPGKTNDKIPKNNPNPKEGKTIPIDEIKKKDPKKPKESTILGDITPTILPEKSQLPFKQNNSQKLSIGTIIAIGMILLGVIILAAFIVYRKRINSRKGAVRLYDDDDSQMIEKPSRITLSDYNDYNIQRTDYTQDYNDYYQTRQSNASSFDSSVGGFFPVPPQRISDNSISPSTPKSATFRDYNNFSKNYQGNSFNGGFN